MKSAQMKAAAGTPEPPRPVTPRGSDPRPNGAVPQPPRQIAPPPVTMPLSVTLSAETAELVRWYQSVSHHQADASVDGAVFGAIARAKESYEDYPSGDDGFDWLLEDILKAIDRLRGQKSRDYGGPFCARRTVELSPEASLLLLRARQSGADPRDIINGCVESMLGCQLDDTSVDFGEAVEAARAARLGREGA